MNITRAAIIAAGITVGMAAAALAAIYCALSDEEAFREYERKHMTGK